MSAPDPGPKTAAQQKRNPKMSMSGIRPIDQQAGPRKAQRKLLLYLCHHSQRRPKTTGTNGSACDSRTPRLGATKECGRRINAALLISSSDLIIKSHHRRLRHVHEKRKSGEFENSDDPTFRLTYRPSLEKKEKAKSTVQPLFLPRSR